MVDETRDESKKEQMAIVLRFVDAKGIIQERFLDLQLRGEWNGLQARVRKVCPYAYYVHCFAHRLQLALVYASRENTPVHNFFNQMVSIINVVCASSKRHDELQIAQEDEVIILLELGEIKSGSGLNQVGTLQRAGSIGRTYTLSQALQKKNQDIHNAMELVSSTKVDSVNLNTSNFHSNNRKGIFSNEIFKNRLRNKMSDEYLTNSLVIYIEKEIAETFDSESIINEFKDLKGRRAAL
ncbi:uncharacterized protein LOC143592307 [Bidens hawaiensis]|uniref:uncharacterized protein LOC143592307 n=1 Tax=Bidens hawaiensis TaxID=980011 RepID=UPI0040490675